MKVSRESLLDSLRAVKPGLSARPGVEQADCVLFGRGQARTFNDHVYCAARTPLGKDVRGAYLAGKILDVLDRIPDEELDVTQGNNCLLFRGKGRVSRASAQADAPGHFDLIDKPKDWKPLSDDFADAVGLVAECASPLEHLVTSFVHVTPGRLEAFDNKQLIRFEVETGVDSPVLLKRNAIRHLTDLGAVEVSQTDHWVHFCNRDGNVLGARRYAESFPDLSDGFRTRGGSRFVLPEGLDEAVKTCLVACPPEGKDKPQFVFVRLSKNRLDVVGDSGSFAHRETREAEWDGPETYFLTFPKVLEELCRRTTECVLTSRSLVIDGGRWKYAVVLGEAGAFGGRYEELLRD